MGTEKGVDCGGLVSSDWKFGDMDLVRNIWKLTWLIAIPFSFPLFLPRNYEDGTLMFHNPQEPDIYKPSLN